ncbi:hypothetical protein CW751_09750 [Brumimicrobium salinarum]|uniref:Uncharacterized protein n=1 Tax=Brumimicrobium salinarum TaxID=2058658 RepID=A0A2I0R245_9FLAO|nr:hypothetical protein [Brumimicrobium salinarum]PKR80642.1 hypothetical protein CW751_09750 [Brumimicrobium salinarum]
MHTPHNSATRKSIAFEEQTVEQGVPILVSYEKSQATARTGAASRGLGSPYINPLLQDSAQLLVTLNLQT